MTALKKWLLGVVLTALAAGLARQLAPKGRDQGVVRLVGGLLLTLALLRPLTSLSWSGVAVETFGAELETRTEELKNEQVEALSQVIEQRTAAYIWDKASQLGLDCQVTVTAQVGESGIPLPASVTVTGAYSQALAEWIEEEVGIPTLQQTWTSARDGA
jgi:stage III sporulation protein AF